MQFPDLVAFKKTAISLAFGFSLLGSQAIGPAWSSEKIDAANALRVTVDIAKVVRIAKAADTIIVGNPSIVDATIQDARTLVLTGRNFGVTNLIVLDSDGAPIVDETIVVNGHETNTVRIYRQSVRETLACSPVCENTLTVGDDAGIFASAESQIKARTGFADNAAQK